MTGVAAVGKGRRAWQQPHPTLAAHLRLDVVVDNKRLHLRISTWSVGCLPSSPSLAWRAGETALLRYGMHRPKSRSEAKARRLDRMGAQTDRRPE